MRTSSKEYRNWTLDDWCEHVRSLKVSSLSEWAQASRSSYSHAVVLGCQRDVARSLGWLPKLEPGEMLRMCDEEFAERFRSKGAKSMTDLWRGKPHWCEFLRREGRLERVAALLGFGYVQEWHPADDVSYYVERCERIGDFTAWCQLDKNASEAARKHGLLKEVKKQAPKRPKKGYPTAGGFCISLPELGLARFLEANDESFVTPMDYPFTFPRGRRHRCKADFYLTGFGAYVEVWSAFPDDDSPYWESYQVRRRFKTDMCERLNLRLLHVEGQILFRYGPEAYIAHIREVMAAAGLKLDSSLDRRALLNPKYASKVIGDGD